MKRGRTQKPRFYPFSPLPDHIQASLSLRKILSDAPGTEDADRRAELEEAKALLSNCLAYLQAQVAELDEWLKCSPQSGGATAQPPGGIKLDTFQMDISNMEQFDSFDLFAGAGETEFGFEEAHIKADPTVLGDLDSSVPTPAEAPRPQGGGAGRALQIHLRCGGSRLDSGRLEAELPPSVVLRCESSHGLKTENMLVKEQVVTAPTHGTSAVGVQQPGTDTPQTAALLWQWLETSSYLMTFTSRDPALEELRFRSEVHAVPPATGPGKGPPTQQQLEQHTAGEGTTSGSLAQTAKVEPSDAKCSTQAHQRLLSALIPCTSGVPATIKSRASLKPAQLLETGPMPHHQRLALQLRGVGFHVPWPVPSEGDPSHAMTSVEIQKLRCELATVCRELNLRRMAVREEVLKESEPAVQRRQEREKRILQEYHKQLQREKVQKERKKQEQSATVREWMPW